MTDQILIEQVGFKYRNLTLIDDLLSINDDKGKLSR